MVRSPDNLSDTPNVAELRYRESKAEKIEYLKKVIPEEIMELHNTHSAWIHDLEFFATSFNCIGVDIAHFVPNKQIGVSAALMILFEQIKSLCNAQSGGIGFINFDGNLAAYVQNETDEQLALAIAQFLKNLNKPIRKGFECAYTTLNIGLNTSEAGRRITRIILQEYQKGNDRVPYFFPNIVFKIKKGVNLNKGDFNYDLFRLANQVTSICMNPTYFNVDAPYNANANAENIGIMGCRTRVVSNKFGEDSSLFRGNVCASTINLVQIALRTGADKEKFYALLNELLETVKQSLMFRFDLLAKEGAFSFYEDAGLYLDADDIDKREMLKHGTLAVGFIGLYETVCLLEGAQANTSTLGLEIVQFMKKKICTFTHGYYQFSLLATAGEGITGKFSQYDKEHYPRYLASLDDKGYYCNSFHIPVFAQASAFEKIDKESPFHKVCNGGCITYVEFEESLAENMQAVTDLVEYAHQKELNYFGINFPYNRCSDCGARCTADQCTCGSRNILQIRRVSGYLMPSEYFAQGKKCELLQRCVHRGQLQF